jgi:hypothetical protein
MTEMIRSRAVLDHAKGQPCQLQLDCCCGDAETTVFAHLNGADFGKGMGIKAHDIAGFFACWRCHGAFDLHTHGLSDAEIGRLVLRAVVNTMIILANDEIIKVPRDKPKAHKVKARKPREQRVTIRNSGRKLQSRPFQKAP